MREANLGMREAKSIIDQAYKKNDENPHDAYWLPIDKYKKKDKKRPDKRKKTVPIIAADSEKQTAAFSEPIHTSTRIDVESMDSFENIISAINSKEQLHIKGKKLKTLTWFLLANAAVILSLVILSGGILLELAPFILILGCIVPFFYLMFSKYFAVKAHKVILIKEDSYRNEAEKNLYNLVTVLSKNAKLPKTPSVGIYNSIDMNAFATGWSKKRSLIAFSSGLLNNMNENETTAVAAHEVAHIATGDMLTLTLVQSVVNFIVLLVTLPITAYNVLAAAKSGESNQDQNLYWLVTILNVVITSILLFLGSLLVKAFSRRREFAADKIASQLVNKEAMVLALKKLSQQSKVQIPKAQLAYSSFKINSPSAFMDIFSTHPSIERRIKHLEQSK